MISFDEALALLNSAARPVGRERLPLFAAAERVLAAPVWAEVDSPRADVSAMDGYAVREADLAALPARLTVVGESLPGQGHAVPVAPGTAVRIFTGAPVPPEADRVVIQENVRREGDVALIDAPQGTARHIRPKGSDFRTGEELVPAGTRLGPRALLAVAGADVGEAEVFRRPRLQLLATGDELAQPGAARHQVQAIPESVSFGVAALAARWGAELTGKLRLKDDLDTMRRAVAAASKGVDLLVVTGGASVGERDFAKAMYGDALSLAFAKVAIKPGKPVWLGRVGATLVLGLPGNPTSALVTARLFLAPLLAGMSGARPDDALRWRQAPLAEPLPAAGSRETFSRGRWDGEQVRLLPNQDSGSQKTLVDAELLLRRPPGDASFAAGDLIDVLDF